ncbi:MAG: M23 family metallopeptidase, partial [Candidatus Margulisbacteria bacterium]|nr:M23 family metallopeptidase [Candidatus Margulisiibacteriota bacterium]
FVGSSLVYTSILTRKLAHYHKAIAKNVEQKSVIETFTAKTDEVSEAIVQLENEDNRLRQLLGLKSWRSKIKLSKQGNGLDRVAEVSQDLLKKADQKLDERRASLSELKKWVGQVQARFANTPSVWPLNGRLVSRFGYRVSPWRGYHSGIDISGNYGSPVRVTANGVVSFAGWRKGYGKTVIVDHGFGKSSLYAHCSRLIVKVGQKVVKGEKICFVGNTGYSTGPHLHYEVRKAGRPVNPVSYLDLNILTASKNWRE